jgi:hypothetical protein
VEEMSDEHRYIGDIDLAVNVEICFGHTRGSITTIEQVTDEVCHIDNVDIFLRITIHVAAHPDTTRAFARIASTVTVFVRLVRIVRQRAVVTSIAQTVTIGIMLILIGYCQAVVTKVTDPVAIAVNLVRIVDLRTIVAGVRELITIGVSLVVIGYARTVIAGIAQRISVIVGL